MSKTLAVKIAQIMQKVQYIQKRGKNKYHGYTYATEADVNDAVREHMAELKMIMIPSVKETSIRETKTKSGNTEYIARVDMDFTFIDGESGESLTMQMSGEGQDVGDKAIYKAISGTQKYMLMKLFMIPTGDDPERDDTQPEQAQQGSQQPNGGNRNHQQPNSGQPINAKNVVLDWRKQHNMSWEQLAEVVSVALQRKVTRVVQEVADHEWQVVMNHMNQIMARNGGQ